jgi:hypothetical protein
MTTHTPESKTETTRLGKKSDQEIISMAIRYAQTMPDSQAADLLFVCSQRIKILSDSLYHSEGINSDAIPDLLDCCKRALATYAEIPSELQNQLIRAIAKATE